MKLYLRDDFWYLDATIEGKRKRISLDTSSKREAKAKAKELLAGVNGGLVLSIDSTKVASAVKEMTLSVALERALRTTWDGNKDWSGYNTIAKQLKKLVGGEVILKTISSSTVAQLKEDLMETGLANGTINRKLAVLSSVMHIAKDEWDVELTIPTFKLLPERNARTRVFTYEEEDRMIEWFKNCPKPEMADLVVILFDTGARLSEALRITGKDVTQSGYVRFERTKNDEGRGIPMTDRVKSILEGLAQGSGAFPTLNKNIACKLMQDFREANSIEDSEWVLHTCRHTCATRLLEAGVDIYTVKEWLGHKSIETTLRYAKMTNMKLNQAKDLLEKRRAA
jgi:integrase